MSEKERNSGGIMGGEVGCRISGVKNVTLLLQKTSFTQDCHVKKIKKAKIRPILAFSSFKKDKSSK